MSSSPSPIFITLLIILIHFHHTSSFSISVENPQQNTILSPNQTFTAGFYPVGQNAYSFAIWFTQKHKHLNSNITTTIVWMANRDKPVNGKRSTLSLLKTGNLVLTDAAQSIVWSTDTVSSNPLQLLLHENGNLVLQEQNFNSSIKNNVILWQSFDFPTDTLLPNQPLTRFTNLVSSRSQTNFSSGFYKLFFDNDNTLGLLYEGPRVSSIYWPDPWTTKNGAVGSGTRSTFNSSRIALLDSLGRFSSSDNFVFNNSDYGTYLQRFIRLDHDGNVRVYSRKDEEQSWFVSGQFRQQPCFIHGICGPNSTCSNDPLNGRKCSCLPGYVWNDDQDNSQGCKPNFQLSCSNNKSHDESRFLALPHVDFYGYDYGFYPNKTFKECEELCLRLCCVGFQFTFNADFGGNYWCYPKIQLLNGHHSQSFLGSFYLQLPKSSGFVDEMKIQENGMGMVCEKNGVVKVERDYMKKKENGSLKFMLWFAGGLGGVELLGFFLVWFFLFRSSKNSGEDNHDYVLAATGFRKFSYYELKQATKGFSQEIGRGAGGSVYKGVLSDNRIAAIKRLHEAQGESESEFLAEVSIIGRLNHMNLIGMWGYCAEGKHRLLVYEYMEKGTLADNLSSNELDWGKRYNIAMGTAKGLAYLHEECLEWILHCDIKPQNILVDYDYQPKVADFGLSKLLNRDDLDNSNFSRIRGTRGYMAPEWVFNLQITSKVDVYSYGVVVLEMITGKSPTTGIQIKEELCHERLVTWVREKRRKGLEDGCWVEQIVDPKLGSNYDVKKMETLANVALDCVADDKDVRPTMSQVVERLLSDEHNYY
ncbi:putative receptor protein kinase ZmPK1 [Trifolium repens]|nr:putative receptor protein kinase ZmPK1 [Trifolium repens]